MAAPRPCRCRRRCSTSCARRWTGCWNSTGRKPSGGCIRPRSCSMLPGSTGPPAIRWCGSTCRTSGAAAASATSVTCRVTWSRRITPATTCRTSTTRPTATSATTPPRSTTCRWKSCSTAPLIRCDAVCWRPCSGACAPSKVAARASCGCSMWPPARAAPCASCAGPCPGCSWWG